MRGWAGAAFASQAQPPLRTRRFVDWLRLEARAGDGGAGCVRCAFQPAGEQCMSLSQLPHVLQLCFRVSCLPRPLTRRCRLSFWQASNKRGPDGGNGGHGGDVVLQADAALRCLAAVHGPALNASTGSRGGPQARQGRAGPALVVRVPVGTTVWQRLDVDGEDMDDADGGAEVPYGSMPSGAPPSGTGRNYRPALQLLADLTEHEATAVVARGGRGGKGNAAIGHAAGKGWQQDAFEPGTPGRWCPSCWSSRRWLMWAWWARRMWGRAPCWCVPLSEVGRQRGVYDAWEAQLTHVLLSCRRRCQTPAPKLGITRSQRCGRSWGGCTAAESTSWLASTTAPRWLTSPGSSRGHTKTGAWCANPTIASTPSAGLAG